LQSDGEIALSQDPALPDSMSGHSVRRDRRIGGLADSTNSRDSTDGDPPAGHKEPRPPILARRPMLWQRSRLLAGPFAASPPSAAERMAEQQVLTELRRMRDEIAGIDGSVVATSDGLLVAHDLPELEPSMVAAVIATTLGLASQAVQVTGRGQFSEAIVRGSAGNLAVFAIGHGAVLAVLGRRDLNIGMLHYQTRAVVERIGKVAPQFRRFATPRTLGPAQ
jgi:uncharacterized protein